MYHRHVCIDVSMASIGMHFAQQLGRSTIGQWDFCTTVKKEHMFPCRFETMCGLSLAFFTVFTARRYASAIYAAGF